MSNPYGTIDELVEDPGGATFSSSRVAPIRNFSRERCLLGDPVTRDHRIHLQAKLETNTPPAHRVHVPGEGKDEMATLTEDSADELKQNVLSIYHDKAYSKLGSSKGGKTSIHIPSAPAYSVNSSQRPSRRRQTSISNEVSHNAFRKTVVSLSMAPKHLWMNATS